MSLFAQIAVVIVALLHFGFLALEAYFWDKPLGLRIFRTDPDFAARAKAIAANMGLYNGFIAVGLLWSVWPVGAEGAGTALATFFLDCVIIAGIVGALTVSSRIMFVQALPGLIALGLVLAG